MSEARHPLPESQMGPAEKLLDLVLNASAHLWHNRPGVEIRGVWHPRSQADVRRRAPARPARAARDRRGGALPALARALPPKTRSSPRASRATRSARASGVMQGRARGAHAGARPARGGRARRRRLGRVSRRRLPRDRRGDAPLLRKELDADADAEGRAARRGAAREPADRGAQSQRRLRRSGGEEAAARALQARRREVAARARAEPRAPRGSRARGLQEERSSASAARE